VYTQCPHCQTLFRISAGQLKAAAGKAHCCRCDRVFSALENLREPEQEEAWPESRLIDDLAQQRNLELPFETPDRDSERDEDGQGISDLLQSLSFEAEPAAPSEDDDSEIPPLVQDDQRDPFEPIYDLSDTGMDSVQIGLDSRLHELPAEEQPAAWQPPVPDSMDPDTEPGDRQQEREEAGETETEAVPSAEQFTASAPFPIPDDLPPLEPTEQEPLAPEEALATAAEARRGIVGWSLAILLLLLLAFAQLAWFGRDHLLRYPAGRTLLEQACELLPCTLPARHSPKDIEVVSRSISSHPDRDDALLVLLTMRNRATFEQAYPMLELSLLDSRGQLVARRSFSPDLYRGDDRALLQPGVPVSLRLELADPGEEVVGFRFDFY